MIVEVAFMRTWRALLREALLCIPELLVLGDYDLEHRTGPAICWARQLRA